MRVRARVHRQSMVMASCTLLFPLALPILLLFPLLGARTRLLPSRLPALMIAFFPLLTSPPVFPSFFPQALGHFSHALGSASTGFFYTRFSFVTLDPWGASPLIFSPAFTLFFFTLVKSYSVSVPCPCLADIACYYVSFCRSFISLPPASFLSPSATGEKI